MDNPPYPRDQWHTLQSNDKFVSRGTSLMARRSEASFSIKHWGIGYQIHKVNNSKVKGVKNIKRLKTWKTSKIQRRGVIQRVKPEQGAQQKEKAFSHFTTSNQSFS